MLTAHHTAEPTAEQWYYDPTPRRMRAARVAALLAVAFYLGSMGAMFGVSIANGYGTGFGDGRLAASCNTPGGPYYPSDMPVEERTCPQGPDGPSGQVDAVPLEHPIPDLLRMALSFGTAAAVMAAWIWMFRNIGTL